MATQLNDSSPDSRLRNAASTLRVDLSAVWRTISVNGKRPQVSDFERKTRQMHISNQSGIQSNRTHHAGEHALRLAGRVCSWLGETFIGLSFLALSLYSRNEKTRDPEKRKRSGSVLLPIHRSGDMPKQKVRCPGCGRDVKVEELVMLMFVEPGGVQVKAQRCTNCEDIYVEKMKMLEKSWLN